MFLEISRSLGVSPFLFVQSGAPKWKLCPRLIARKSFGKIGVINNMQVKNELFLIIPEGI